MRKARIRESRRTFRLARRATELENDLTNQVTEKRERIEAIKGLGDQRALTFTTEDVTADYFDVTGNCIGNWQLNWQLSTLNCQLRHSPSSPSRLKHSRRQDTNSHSAGESRWHTP